MLCLRSAEAHNSLNIKSLQIRHKKNHCWKQWLNFKNFYTGFVPDHFFYTMQRYIQNLEYAKNLSDYLQKQRWDYFVTFTTRYELTLPSARRLMERFMDRTGQKSFTQQKLFWAAERFECKYGYHVHGLLETKLDYQDIIQAYQIVTGKNSFECKWEDKNNWQAITLRKYNPSKAAAKYCAKYILKRYADYDFL